MISRRATNPDSNYLNFAGQNAYGELYNLLWDINENIKFLLGADKLEKKAIEDQKAKLIEEGWIVWCGNDPKHHRPDLPEGTEVIYMHRDGDSSVIPYKFSMIEWRWWIIDHPSPRDIVAYKIAARIAAEEP